MYGIDWEDSEVAEHKYKVGDKVRVIRDSWCGTTAAAVWNVTEVRERGVVALRDDGKDKFPWLFTFDQVEPAPKFKVGDVVRVIDDRGGCKIGDVGQVTDIEDHE